MIEAWHSSEYACGTAAISLDEAVERFIRDRAISACTAATIACYRSQLTPLLKFAKKHRITKMQEDDLREFLLFRSRVSQATLYAATVRIKTFFTWCASQNIYPDIGARIRKPRQASKVINALSIDEVRAMLALCTENGYVGRRDEAFVRFLIDTGARVSEALDLEMERLDLDAGRALLNGKGRKQRIVFFGQRTKKALMRFILWRKKQKIVSSTFFMNHDGSAMNRRHACQTITRLGKRANIRDKRCSPHTLRHTSALLFLRRGGDGLSLQRLLGHTTLAMTNRYLASVSVDDLEAAHRKACPGDAI